VQDVTLEHASWELERKAQQREQEKNAGEPRKPSWQSGTDKKDRGDRAGDDDRAVITLAIGTNGILTYRVPIFR